MYKHFTNWKDFNHPFLRLHCSMQTVLEKCFQMIAAAVQATQLSKDGRLWLPTPNRTMGNMLERYNVRSLFLPM
jgi:hypothetical protein